MIQLRKSEVFVILCVLVWSGHSLKTEAKSAPCNIVLDETYRNKLLNCSFRNIESISDWPKNISGIDKDDLVRITFYNNNITNITQLPSIPGSRVAISFKKNKVVEIVASAFFKIDRLVFLDLTNNNLSGEVLRSEIFQGPYNDGVYGNIALEKLYLGFNQIHSLDRYLFQYTPNLTQLYLDHNPIEILDHVTILALSSAINLEILDLANTGIDSVPYDAFRGLLKLRQIDLSGNRFVTVPESLNIVGKTLEYLTFNNNPVVELNDDSFVGLTALKSLEVGYNDYLEEIKRSTFSPLRSLNTLHLCHNHNLRYISHNAFRGMKDKWTISEVYLDDNNLSELSTDLMPWSKLQILGMSGNNWLCNCDLANIVTTQGAGQKLKGDEIPLCASPMRLYGEYLTNITEHLSFCPTFDPTFKAKKTFSIGDLKPKHILWSIIGVALVVVIGMILGLLVNTVKAIYNKKMRNEPIRYINLNADATFA